MLRESERPIVKIPARLRGIDGDVAGCLIETWKERASTGTFYTRCRIASEPPSLPDGEYVVEFADYRIPTDKLMSRWELIFLAPEVRISDAA